MQLRASPHTFFKGSAGGLLLKANIENAKTIPALRRLLEAYQESIVIVGAHFFYLAKEDFEAMNHYSDDYPLSRLARMGKFDLKKVGNYHRNVVRLFQNPQRDYANAVFVLPNHYSKGLTEKVFMKNGQIFAPANPVIYSASASVYRPPSKISPATESLVCQLERSTVKVVLVFGIFRDACVKTCVDSIRKVITKLGRNDLYLVTNQLITKNADDFMARKFRFEYKPSP